MSETEKVVVPFSTQILYVPTNLQAEGKDFVGWYTERDGQGTQVANAAGMLFQYSTMNRELAELGGNNELTLYPYFKWKVYDVVAHLENGQTITAQIEHGKSLSSISALNVPFDGYFVTGWKLKDAQDGAVYDGIVTSNVELVVAKKSKAITITYNGNGGSTPAAQIVAEGSTVNLNTSSRDSHRFNGWQLNGSGSIIKSLLVGSQDVYLVANWTKTNGEWSNYSSLTIADEHTNKNPYDAVSFNTIFGKSKTELYNEGFRTLTITLTVYIVEKDDGYQEIYFGNNTNLDVDNYCGYGRLWYKSDIDTAGGSTGSGVFQTSFSVSLANVENTMYFCYSANGWWGDTWVRDYIYINCRIS